MDPYAWEDAIFLLTSRIYPIDVIEHMESIGGIIYAPGFTDYDHMVGSGAILAGDLFSSLISYTNGIPENIQGAGAIVAGDFYLGLVNYADGIPENIQGAGTIVAGDLTLGLVTYTHWPAENITGAGAIIGGTLT